ncbi:uncharacterized protein DNG_08131 [Cephalotrichum gorgonifer]|uniref:Uncharacterized protein n=1 Tax=Cephalotrichum gorgonifer TaxID=2041049 RepID=A0AAE8SY39_9PEZI|nr:uncharacterized protein DNG_08131 [Cephalotrichum gorgonifer]
MAAVIHVVSKRDNTRHEVCRLDEGQASAGKLAESSIRVRTGLMALTSNNLSYARAGAFLHWWDTYPVPDSAPAPYNDNGEWGIVPAWGYGRVVDSTIDSIEAGSLLWGFWPASSHAVDLQLRPSQPSGHWVETSPHRSQLMTLYNRYEQVEPGDDLAMKMAALCKPLWTGPYLLNRTVFSKPGVHPLGVEAPWSEEDADLSSAVVINASASSKTGRSFSWALARDRDAAAGGPLALLQLTSAPQVLPRFSDCAFPIKSGRYGDPGAMEWVAGFKPARVVIVDFGAADPVIESLASDAGKIAASVTVIAVGHEAKVYSDEEIQAHAVLHKTLGKVQLNASGLRDRAMETLGPEKFFRSLDEDWVRCYEEEGLGRLELRELSGVEGDQGVKGAWDDLCSGNVPPNVGIVGYISLE